jgi:hypothetical protein
LDTEQKQPFNNHTKWEANLDPNGCWWTHRYHVQKGHDSFNWKGKLGCHQDTATCDNTQGRSTKGKAWQIGATITTSAELRHLANIMSHTPYQQQQHINCRHWSIGTLSVHQWPTCTNTGQQNPYHGRPSQWGHPPINK